MKLKDEVAIRIRSIRKRRGLTQEELAEQIGRTADAVSQLERGLSLPSFETLERLSEELAVPVRDFFGAEGTSGISEHRQTLITRLLDATGRLSDRDLNLAVQIVEVISSRSSARPK